MRKLTHAEILRLDPAEALRTAKHPVTVVLDDVRSLYNVGAIFRTADAAGVEQIILGGITGTPDNPAIHKTALGSQLTVPWVQRRDTAEAVAELKTGGYTIVVAEITDSPSDLGTIGIDHFPLCIVIGNEITGVSDEIVSIADMALEIPQFGAKHSLNAAVAFGILVYDVVRTYRRVTGLAP